MKTSLLAFIFIQATAQFFQAISCSEFRSESGKNGQGSWPLESKYLSMIKENEDLYKKALEAVSLDIVDESDAELLQKIKKDEAVIIHFAKEERIKFVERANHADLAYRKFYKQRLFALSDKIVGSPVRTTSYAAYVWSKHQNERDYLHLLSHMFPKMRRVMGDGDCFYRSFMFALFMFHRYSTTAQKVTHIRLFRDVLERYRENELMRNVCYLAQHFVKFANLHKIEDYDYLFNQKGASNALVFLLRIMVGERMQNPVFAEYMTTDPKEFVYSKVVIMGKWGGEFEITVAQQIFNLTVGITDLPHQNRVVYGDGSSEDYNDIELIYTGNHYDIFEIPRKNRRK